MLRQSTCLRTDLTKNVERWSPTAEKLPGSLSTSTSTCKYFIIGMRCILHCRSSVFGCNTSLYLFVQGVFNLPRYYPTYQRFDNNDNDDDDNDADADAAGSTWRSGKHQRTLPFYRDQLPVTDDEPIYSKPNKSAARGRGAPALFFFTDQFHQ